MTPARRKLCRTVLSLFMATMLLTSCASSLFQFGSDAGLPPILATDELIRPYSQLGRIRIAVEIYGPEIPNLQDWGFTALREEAARMGADAIILPEVTAHPTSYLIIPSNEYRATGVAIKFK